MKAKANTPSGVPRRPVPLKRYMILVQHEVIVYAENEKAAASSLLSNEFIKNRTNPKCVFIQQIPLPNDEIMEPIIDVRKAPGS